MNKIRNAFDQLVLNTIKTVRVFSDKSERELAEELGLLELYDRDNDKTHTVNIEQIIEFFKNIKNQPH